MFCEFVRAMQDVFNAILNKFDTQVINFEKNHKTEDPEQIENFEIVLKEVELMLWKYDRDSNSQNTSIEIPLNYNRNSLYLERNRQKENCWIQNNVLKLNDPLFEDSGYFTDDDCVEVLEICVSAVLAHHQVPEKCYQTSNNRCKLSLFRVFIYALCRFVTSCRVIEMLNILLNVSHKKIPFILILYELKHIVKFSIKIVGILKLEYF